MYFSYLEDCLVSLSLLYKTLSWRCKIVGKQRRRRKLNVQSLWVNVLVIYYGLQWTKRKVEKSTDIVEKLQNKALSQNVC